MEQSFIDTKGRTWTVALNVAIVRKVHQKTGVHLAKLLEPEEIGKLQSDGLLLCDMLWLVIEDDAVKAQVTRPDFESSLSGKTIQDAANALLVGLTYFLSDARRGELLRNMLKRFNELQELRTEAAEKMIAVYDGLKSTDKLTNVPDTSE